MVIKVSVILHAESHSTIFVWIDPIDGCAIMDKESDCVAWQFNFRRLVSQTFEHLSKTTKLLLLDSLLQEVCISSGSMGRSP